MTITITGAAGASRRNDSGYRIIEDKVAELPEGWEETDGYREIGTGQDIQVTRCFVGPWSSRISFLEWALGYSYTSRRVYGADDPIEAPELGSGVVYVYGPDRPADGMDLPTPLQTGRIAVTLRRIVPAQDLDRPWLFCNRCELVNVDCRDTAQLIHL